MLGLCLATQIASGLFLAMYFTRDVSLAYDSVIYISRDVSYGYFFRALHANGASVFFICMYLHLGRGLYYRSYVMKETWLVGVTLFLLTIATAFLGYVLPWGQISYWAATVITNLLSAIPFIGNTLVGWLWGGFSVRNPTLIRFYALHFILPFIISAFSLIHIRLLHTTGRGNPLGVSASSESVKFHPYFTVKDRVGFLGMWLGLGLLIFFFPRLFIDPENYIQANALVTPTHIQPEWYFLPMYAILRSIPRKLGGVVALLTSVGILYVVPFIKSKSVRSSGFDFFTSSIFWIYVVNFIGLGWIGSKVVESPFEGLGIVFTFLYFSLLILL